MKSNMVTRCEWPSSNPLMITYHDEEWGTPVHDDQKLFEFLLLEAFQAGLSWETILNRREGFRNAFDNFDYKKIVNYTDEDVQRLMNDEGIIRNRLKILSTISNAKLFMEIQKEFGSFDKYIWKFVNNKPIQNNKKSISDIQATTEVSDEMSKELKKRGFKFFGSTIAYAFMQAAGLVNDHTTDCFRFKEVETLK